MKPHQRTNLSVRDLVAGDPGVQGLTLHVKQGSCFAHVKQPFWIIKAHGLSPPPLLLRIVTVADGPPEQLPSGNAAAKRMSPTVRSVVTICRDILRAYFLPVLAHRFNRLPFA